MRLKGGSTATTIFRVEWETDFDDDDEDDDHTTLSRIVDARKAELTLKLLDYDGTATTVVLRPEDTPYHVGRNPHRCQHIVNAGFVSRDHCHIDYEHGNFLLRDHSSNGTHVIMIRQQPVYDPVSHLVYTSNGRNVSHSWVNGQLLVKDAKLTGIDERSLIHKQYRSIQNFRHILPGIYNGCMVSRDWSLSAD